MSDPRLDRPPGLWARMLVGLARVLLPLPAEPPRAPRSVLVVRTDDRVGNALLTLPLVRGLQNALPAARVDVLLAARRAHVAEGLFRVVRFEKSDAFKHPIRFLRELLKLRRAYDVVIDAAHWHAFSVTSALLSRWIAARWVIGAERGPARIYSRAVPPPPEGMTEVEAKVLLGRALVGELPVTPLETSLGRSAPLVQPPFIALNPGARKADHRWPVERFAAVARALRERMRVIVLWGPGEEELARAVGAELAPPTDLEQLAAIFRAASLVITNDTGPLHLAAACGAKTIAVLLDPAGLRWVSPGVEGLVAPSVEEVVSAASRLLDSAGRTAEPARPSKEGAS